MNLALSETPKTGFVASRPKYEMMQCMIIPKQCYVCPAKSQIGLDINQVRSEYPLLIKIMQFVAKDLGLILSCIVKSK